MGQFLRFVAWLACVGALFWFYVLMAKSQYTEAVPCNITSSVVRLQSRIVWTARYQYEWEGAHYTGGQESLSTEESEELCDRYPVGLNVCYVDPTHPSFSKLDAERYFSPASVYMLAMLTLVTLWSWRRFSLGKLGGSSEKTGNAILAFFFLGVVLLFNPVRFWHQLWVARDPVPVRLLRIDNLKEVRVYLEYQAGGRTRLAENRISVLNRAYSDHLLAELRANPRLTGWLAQDDPNDLSLQQYPVRNALEFLYALTPLWPFLVLIPLCYPHRWRLLSVPAPLALALWTTGVSLDRLRYGCDLPAILCLLCGGLGWALVGWQLLRLRR